MTRSSDQKLKKAFYCRIRMKRTRRDTLSFSSSPSMVRAWILVRVSNQTGGGKKPKSSTTQCLSDHFELEFGNSHISLSHRASRSSQQRSSLANHVINGSMTNVEDNIKWKNFVSTRYLVSRRSAVTDMELFDDYEFPKQGMKFDRVG